jgi:hypothetical protein
MPDEQQASKVLAALTAPLAASNRTLADLVQLAAAAAMTADGAGLRLAAGPGTAGQMIAAGCAVVLAARLAAGPVARLLRAGRGEPGWTAAAAVHERSLPGRVPAATLAAAGRYLSAIAAARGQSRAWLYVHPCAGEDSHTRLCRSAGVWQPGGRLMAIVGEHAAADPAAARVSLGHELGHVTGWTYRAFVVLHGARKAGGWGWAAAGLIGAGWGWAGVLAAAAVFQAASLLAVWTVEAACDRRADRAEGRAASLDGFAYIAAAQAADRPASRWGRAAGLVLRWAAGPSHPPVWLRTAVIRSTTPARRPATRPDALPQGSQE